MSASRERRKEKERKKGKKKMGSRNNFFIRETFKNLGWESLLSSMECYNFHKVAYFCLKLQIIGLIVLEGYLTQNASLQSTRNRIEILFSMYIICIHRKAHAAASDLFCNVHRRRIFKYFTPFFHRCPQK